MNERHYEIINWVTSLLPNHSSYKLCPIIGDASTRNYYRIILSNRPYIVMDSQFDASMPQFVKIANLLDRYKVNVPKIVGKSLKDGLVIMSDLGQEMYLPNIESADIETQDKLYQDAIQTIIKMQLIPESELLNLRIMEDKYVLEKLDIFETWYLKEHLNSTVDFSDVKDELINIFVNEFNPETTTFVHLDYHSRNLMLQEQNNPGVLDFQDAMRGPYSYDLVSLLHDAYYTLPKDRILNYIQFYYENAIKAKVDVKLSLEQYKNNFFAVAMQRHLKNLGVFARLNKKYGKSSYLQYIPRLLGYIDDIIKQDSRFECLAGIFEEVTKTEQIPQ